MIMKEYQYAHSAGVQKPSFSVPSAACDCHMHIIDSQYPTVANAHHTHDTASLTDYLKLQKRLGMSRMVIVQPSFYGFDHGVLISALNDAGSIARGIAVVTPEVEQQELEWLAENQIVGVRLNLVQYGATDLSMVSSLAKRLNKLGWHLQVHMPPNMLVHNVDFLLHLNVDVVVDHLASINVVGANSKAVAKTMARLLGSGRGWLKLSGAYMASSSRTGNYQDLDEFIQKMVSFYSDRLVWGSDWPHVTEKDKPNDATLLDLLGRWVPDSDTREAILVRNPEILYKF